MKINICPPHNKGIQRR